MEQFERAKRYLDRMKTIYSGVFSLTGHNKQEHEDDVISFFIHCYHVRDWILHLNKIGVTAKEIDKFIDQHECLRICADLANGSKHCKLTRTLRTLRQPHIVYKEYHTSAWLTDNGGGECLVSKYSILCGDTIHDALELAELCMQKWIFYIDELNSIYTSRNDTIADF